MLEVAMTVLWGESSVRIAILRGRRRDWRDAGVVESSQSHCHSVSDAARTYLDTLDNDCLDA